MTTKSKKLMMVLLTLMLAGRAMTLAFISRVGQGGPGDPPSAWMMPLVGDAVIGLAALGVAYALLQKRGLWVLTLVLVWNAIGIWDALSAYAIHVTVPWPEFFMIQTFGPSMFFMASAMHGLLIGLALQPDVRQALLGEEDAGLSAMPVLS